MYWDIVYCLNVLYLLLLSFLLHSKYARVCLRHTEAIILVRIVIVAAAIFYPLRLFHIPLFFFYLSCSIKRQSKSRVKCKFNEIPSSMEYFFLLLLSQSVLVCRSVAVFLCSLFLCASFASFCHMSSKLFVNKMFAENDSFAIFVLNRISITFGMVLIF